MPLRRTKRSDGQKRPRWKDGSHVSVESTHANESQCDEVALEPNLQTEPLVTFPPLLRRNREHEVSTRDRPANAEADAGAQNLRRTEEICLAILPYGNVRRVNPRGAFESISLRRCNPMAEERRDSGGVPRRAPRAGPRTAAREKAPLVEAAAPCLRRGRLRMVRSSRPRAVTPPPGPRRDSSRPVIGQRGFPARNPYFLVTVEE